LSGVAEGAGVASAAAAKAAFSDFKVDIKELGDGVPGAIDPDAGPPSAAPTVAAAATVAAIASTTTAANFAIIGAGFTAAATLATGSTIPAVSAITAAARSDEARSDPCIGIDEEGRNASAATATAGALDATAAATAAAAAATTAAAVTGGASHDSLLLAAATSAAAAAATGMPYFAVTAVIRLPSTF